MKAIKRIFLFLSVIVVSLVCFSIQTNVFAQDQFTNGYATYKIKREADQKNLGYGVNYRRDISTLATNQKGITNNTELNKEYDQQVNVLEIMPSDEVQLVPYAFLDGSNWVHTTLKKAAKQYEATHPGYKVIAGVNGDYFQIKYSVKASTGVTISQGEFYKTISGHGPVNTLAIRNNGEGKQLFSTNITSQAPVLSIYDENDNIVQKIIIDKVNEDPGENQTALFYANRTENFGYKVGTINTSNVYVVNRGLYAVTTMVGSFYGVGKVTSFVSDNITLSSGQFAIKTNNPDLKAIFDNGVATGNLKIRCQYEYTDESLAGINDFIGYPYYILDNGTVNTGDHERHPRTMIGQKENGEIVLAVIDGRQGAKGMYGASSSEMAAVMGYYGCVDAWNLDGGGSSTMIVRKLQGWDYKNGYNDTEDSEWYVTNSPSDASERNDGNHLLVVVKSPEIQLNVFEFGDNYVVLNVALLSQINKYSELYILINNEYYEVTGEQVKITGLKEKTKYTAYVLSKIDGEYVDLLTNISFRTNKQKPSSINLDFSMIQKGDSKLPFILYNADINEAITKIVLVIGEKRYISVSQTLILDSEFNLNEFLKEGYIEIYYEINPDLPEEMIKLTSFGIDYNLEFSFEQILSIINESITDTFLNY